MRMYVSWCVTLCSHCVGFYELAGEPISHVFVYGPRKVYYDSVEPPQDVGEGTCLCVCVCVCVCV